MSIVTNKAYTIHCLTMKKVSLESPHKALEAYLRIKTKNHADMWSDWLQYWF